MKAVNLLPDDARRSRGGASRSVNVGALGPATFIIVALVLVLAIIVLRVLADNNVNNKKATLAAVQAQVSTEEADAAKLATYIGFVSEAEQRKTAIHELALERFPWKRTLDQLTHVLPASTTLQSLNATTAPTTAVANNFTTVSGPTFTLAGCANTPNQNGVATVLRRLTTLTGVTNVGFDASNRSETGGDCGNNFNVTLTFVNPGGTATTPATVTTPTATTPGVTATSTSTTPTTTGTAG